MTPLELFELASQRRETIEKEASLLGWGARALGNAAKGVGRRVGGFFSTKPKLPTAAPKKSGVGKMLAVGGTALTGAEMLGAGADASKQVAQSKRMYQNMATKGQYLGM